MDPDVVGEVTGEIVKDDDGVLRIDHVHVVYRVSVAASDRETVERVHGFHADKCPVARSIKGAVKISTEIRYEGD